MSCYPPADWSCYPGVQSLDDAVKQKAELLGWSALNSLIAYQVPGDNCPIVVRPCSKRCTIGTWYESHAGSQGQFAGASNGVFSPYVGSAGQWINGCGCATDDCSCTVIQQVRLPGPVGAVTKVTLDGAVLDPSAYRVDNGIYLVRQDGQSWPACQDMNAAPGEAQTFTVEYIRGYPVNPLLTMAVGRLAAEFAKACLNQSCALPSNVTAVTRQGVTQEFQQNPFDQGTTGMPDVDAIIRIFNPYGMKTPPRVMSVDVPEGRVQTW